MHNLNPFALLDSILNDYASPRARRLIHTLLLLAAIAVTAYLSFEGDWREALVALAAAIYAGANKANTPETSLADAEEEGEDDLSYEEAGGLPFPADYDESALYGDGVNRGDTGYSDPERA